MKKKLLCLFFSIAVLQASDTVIVSEDNTALTMEEALNILHTQNLEIKAAEYDERVAKEDVKTASGNNWGKLDFIQDVANSDDAGNVFGFKLTSREANFGDFGAKEFMTNFGLCQQGNAQACNNMYNKPPEDLNYPDSRTFFQSKLKYEVPLFTGFKLSSYTNIMKSMAKMKKLEKEKLILEKEYQLKKSFYDMALLQSSIDHMHTIHNNIETLENMTQEMLKIGYAKKVDLLEVEAKKANVERLINQMEANKQLLYHFISFLLNKKVTKIETPKNEIAMPTITDETILANNVDIQRAQTGLEIRKNMIAASEADLYYPMVGAFAELATADDTFLGDANDHKAYTVGARLTWNIFNGGIDKAKVEKAKIEKLKTAAQVELAKKGIALKVAKIRTEITSLDGEIESLEKELALADRIYQNYEARYKENLASMSDVIIKQSQQIQKVLQLLQAKNKRTERIFALIKLANGEK